MVAKVVECRLSWICAPAPEIGEAKSIVIGPGPGSPKFVHSKLSPGAKFPSQPLPWSTRLKSVPAGSLIFTDSPPFEVVVTGFETELTAGPRLPQSTKSLPLNKARLVTSTITSARAANALNNANIPAMPMVRFIYASPLPISPENLNNPHGRDSTRTASLFTQRAERGFSEEADQHKRGPKVGVPVG